MRYVKYCLTMLLLIFLLNKNMLVSAKDAGFTMEEFVEDEHSTFLSKFHISLLNVEPPKRPIDCFDVNEKGMIAVGFDASFSSKKRTICIYSSDGIFQYGYQFDDYGIFGVEWDEDRLIIYLVRSNIAVVVNKEGVVEEFAEIKNTAENHSYWRKSVFLTKRVVGDTEYALKNEMGIFNLFASGYSQMIVTNAEGKARVIFDVNAAYFTNMVAVFVGVLIFGGIVVFGVVREFMKQKRKISVS